VFLIGVLEKAVFFVWCFCGEFVVNCVAEPGQLCGFAPRLKVGQDSNKYFLRLSVRVSAPVRWGLSGWGIAPALAGDGGTGARGGWALSDAGFIDFGRIPVRATGKMYSLDWLWCRRCRRCRREASWEAMNGPVSRSDETLAGMVACIRLSQVQTQWLSRAKINGQSLRVVAS
jgi:hypothetical protein